MNLFLSVLGLVHLQKGDIKFYIHFCLHHILLFPDPWKHNEGISAFRWHPLVNMVRANMSSCSQDIYLTFPENHRYAFTALMRLKEGFPLKYGAVPLTQNGKEVDVEEKNMFSFYETNIFSHGAYWSDLCNWTFFLWAHKKHSFPACLLPQ